MKKKVVTITFSPSIDKSVTIKKWIPEAKMKCYNVETYAGGGGINIAKVLGRFGTDVTAVFPADSCNTLFFEKQLHAENVKVAICVAENKTRENIAVFEATTNKQYRLVLPANSWSKKEWDACLVKIKQCSKIDFLVVSGSLPQNAPATIFKTLSKLAVAKKAKFLVDTSGKALINVVQETNFLIKPNLEEFKTLTDNKLLEIGNLKKIALQFLKNTKCENIVISLGSKGAMLINLKEAHYIKPPKVKVISTVGAGDSMMAGILYGLQNNLPLKECLQLGIAFGTATTLKAGTSLCTKADVDKLLPKIISKTKAASKNKLI